MVLCVFSSPLYFLQFQQDLLISSQICSQNQLVSSQPMQQPSLSFHLGWPKSTHQILQKVLRKQPQNCQVMLFRTLPLGRLMSFPLVQMSRHYLAWRPCLQSTLLKQHKIKQIGPPTTLGVFHPTLHPVRLLRKLMQLISDTLLNKISHRPQLSHCIGHQGLQLIDNKHTPVNLPGKLMRIIVPPHMVLVLYQQRAQDQLKIILIHSFPTRPLTNKNPGNLLTGCQLTQCRDLRHQTLL